MAVLLFSDEEVADLAAVLAEEMPAARLRALVETEFGTSVDLIAPGADQATASSGFVKWVNDSKRAQDLVKALLRDGARTPKLMIFLQSVLGQKPAEQSGLQALFSYNLPTQDWNVFLNRMAKRSRQICFIQVKKKPKGTGALIAPDRILTAFHVVADMFDAERKPLPAAPGDIVCRFDFAALADGIELSKTVDVSTPEQWLICSSPQHPMDGEDDLKAPPESAECLDYAVIKLERAVGSEPLRDSGGAIRKWIAVPTADVQLGQDQPMVVGQHPFGVALQVAFGRYQGENHYHTRLRHNVETANGSSGAPCFDLGFDLVGVHHVNISALKLNQAVPINLIRKHLALADHPPDDVPDFHRVWKLASGKSVLGRTEFQQAAWNLRTADSKARILIVRGPPGSGRTFSIELLKEIVAPASDVVIHYDLLAIQDKTPDGLLADFARDAGLDLAAAPMPRRPELRQTSRWASTTLFKWFCDLFAKRHLGVADMPRVWIAIDNDDRGRCRDEETRDLMLKLMAESLALPALRWLLVGSAPDIGVVPSGLVAVSEIEPPGQGDVAELIRALTAGKVADNVLDAIAQLTLGMKAGSPIGEIVNQAAEVAKTLA